MKPTASLSASSRRIRSAYHSRNCPQMPVQELNRLGQDLLGGLVFGIVLVGLVLLLLL